MKLLAKLTGRWCYTHQREHGRVYVAALGQSVLVCPVCAKAAPHRMNGRIQELQKLYERTEKRTSLWIATKDVGLLLDRIRELENQ